MSDSITGEFDSLQLGDKRLDKRCKSIAQRFAANPPASINVASQGWSETHAACVGLLAAARTTGVCCRTFGEPRIRNPFECIAMMKGNRDVRRRSDGIIDDKKPGWRDV